MERAATPGGVQKDGHPALWRAKIPIHHFIELLIVSKLFPSVAGRFGWYMVDCSKLSHQVKLKEKLKILDMHKAKNRPLFYILFDISIKGCRPL